MNKGDSPANIAYFMGDRGYQNSRTRQELVQVGFLPDAQVLRSVQDHGRETRSGACQVGRKPDIGLEDLAVRSPAPALHRRSETLTIAFKAGHVDERWQIIVDGHAWEGPGIHCE